MTKRGHIFSRFLFLGLASAAISMSNAALADGGAKFLGNITTGGTIRNDMGDYWNQITPENGCKWGSIHSLSNGMSGTSVFNWDNYDKCAGAYEWAKEKPGERHFKFHALVWGSQYPSFLCKKKNPSITVEKTREYITEWFDAVAKRFPDLEYIDVVNEAIWSGNNYHSGYLAPAEGAEGVSTDDAACGGSYIIEALGGDSIVNGKHQYNFITNAFKMAHERWPNAVLIYNDYNTLSWQMNEGIELVQTIIKNGAPVDAYGQQGHDCKDLRAEDWTDQWGNKQLSFSNRLKKIHEETGLPLFITEYDIGEANDESQKNVIAQQIPFLWETEWIAGITIWGYIDGATWRDNTGLMKPNGDVKSNPNVSATNRASMNWLVQYFSEHLNDGKNTTGMGGGTVVDPVPQKPFNSTNTPWAIPGKIEAEDFDIPGKGSGNDSYKESKSAEDGDSDYRAGTGVDLYKRGSGIVVGYNDEGDWLEYTVNIQEAGNYTFFAAVAADHAGGSFKMSLDGIDITDEIAVPANKEAAVEGEEENYNDYNKVSANVTFSENQVGEHVLRLTITGVYFDIDYFNFVKGQNAEDDVPLNSSTSTNNSSSSTSNNPNSSTSNNPNTSTSNNPNTSTSDNPGNSTSDNPGNSTSDNPGYSTSDNQNSSLSGEGEAESSVNGAEGNTEDPAAIGNNIHMATHSLTDYDIIDIHGVRIGRLSAYNAHQAIEIARYSNTIKSSGIYYIRSRATGKIQSLRIVR